MINLVKNALKFTSEGSIDVCADYSLNEEILSVKVTDTGAGIAEEDIPQLFTRFGKLHRTAKMNSEGIGLGLTIVKQIVEESGGNIIVHSDGVDCGSCFEFSIAMKVVKKKVAVTKQASKKKLLIEQDSSSPTSNLIVDLQRTSCEKSLSVMKRRTAPLPTVPLSPSHNSKSHKKDIVF